MQELKFIVVVSLQAAFLLSCSAPVVSKEDAKADPAISTGSGKDMYYEYSITSMGKSMKMSGTTKMFISSAGDMRVEMTLSNSAMPGKNPSPIVIIGHADKPTESISIDDETKTYSVNHFTNDDFNSAQKMQSTATEIGKEKILNFSSVHARIITTQKFGSLYTSTDTVDLWKSKEVPVLSSIGELMDKFESKTGNLMFAPETVTQLKQMGCEGFMTKLIIKGKSSSTIEELTKVDHRDLPANLFQVPSGYKEEKE